MAKRNQEITVISYVHKGGELVRFDDLTEEEKVRAATELKIRWLNGLFDGKAVFYPAGDEAARKAALQQVGAAG